MGKKGFNKTQCMGQNYPNYRGNYPLEKRIYFFLGPWHLVCQFIEISNQMESTGEVSNVEQKNLYNGLLYKKNYFQWLILRQLALFDWKFP